jgi:hypothetical protein
MGRAAGPILGVGMLDAETVRRKKRQGSENRELSGRLQVRYDPSKLQALEAVAGKQLPSLIREYGDLLTQLLPVAGERGVDPVELIREAATSLLGASA